MGQDELSIVNDGDDLAQYAVLDGGPALEAPVSTLAGALIRATGLTNSDAITCLDSKGAATMRSYGELLDDAARILGGIREFGALPGDRVVVQLDDTLDLMATFWACQLGGFVAVLVPVKTPQNSRLSAEELLSEVCEMLDAPWVISAADTLSAMQRCIGPLARLRTESIATEFHVAGPDDIATLLLTSGSTGLPKAVMLTHRNILSRSIATAHVRRMSERNRTFNWMPLDHVGGLVMFHVRDVLLGCRQVHARTQWVLDDPLRWLDAISTYECDTTWAPNFAFALIVDRAEQHAGRSWDLRGLDYIMNGGESIKQVVAQRFLTLLAPFGLPPTAIHPGWGMTETSSGVVDCVFLPTDGPDADRFLPVGSPHPGVSVRIMDDNEQLLAEGDIGWVHVTGTPITDGYYGNDEYSNLSFSSDGWFKTGDLGYISNGLLTVAGRGGDVLEIQGTNYYGHEIEALVEELPFVEPTYTVACDVSGELNIIYHPRSGQGSLWESWWISQHVSQRLGVVVGHVRAMPREAVPKTGMGKLKRVQLSEQLRRIAE